MAFITGETAPELLGKTVDCYKRLEGGCMRYRKKPVVVDAFQLGVDDMPDWFADAEKVNKVILHGGRIHADIETLEGWHHASYGDYIIRGVKGELYPCKPDIFKLTTPMKILKPGKVEQRKFICPRCGCIFVAHENDVSEDYVACPQEGCGYNQNWERKGEPYEEPVRSDEALLADLIHSSRAIDFDTSVKLAEWLTDNGVTFREV